jgi:hypothetical protein
MATTCPTCKKTRSGKPCRTCKLPAVIGLPAPPPSPPPTPPEPVPVPVPVPTTNEPAGMTRLVEWVCNQDLPVESGPIPGSPDFHVAWNAPIGDPEGWAVRADHDGKSVCDFVYPAGMVEGTAPATVWKQIHGDEVYVRFWWKPTEAFDVGPNGTKLLHLMNGAGGKQFLILYPDGKLHVYPEYDPRDQQWRSPLASVPPVPLGQGHIVEWWANRITGDGAVWLDSQPNLRYAGARSTQPFDYFFLSPTFGGNSGARKLRTDHFYFGNIVLSTR